jgi:hypothetical protein
MESGPGQHPICSVAPRLFNGLWGREIVEQEGRDLDTSTFFFDQIRRLAPLRGEAKDRGKDMRNLEMLAWCSLWDECNVNSKTD